MATLKVVGIIQTGENDYIVQVDVNPNIEGLNGRFLHIADLCANDILQAFGIIQDDIKNYIH